MKRVQPRRRRHRGRLAIQARDARCDTRVDRMWHSLQASLINAGQVLKVDTARAVLVIKLDCKMGVPSPVLREAASRPLGRLIDGVRVPQSREHNCLDV